MKCVIDTSSLINLFNGDVFVQVNSLEYEWVVPYSVAEELISYEKLLSSLIAAGIIQYIGDDVISATYFLDAKIRYRLGDGEIECICLAKQFDWRIALDDGKARMAAAKELDEERVIGSIGLLQQCVFSEAMSVEEAYHAYRIMLAKGAFFPKLRREDFNIAVA